MEWEETGKRAFYGYFYMFDKTIGHDVSRESASGEIEGSMEDAGIEIENLWYEELPVEAWGRCLQRLCRRIQKCRKRGRL